MHFFKKYPIFFKFTCLTTVSCGAAWVYYQTKRTQKILSSALDTSVLSVAESRLSKDQSNAEFLIVDFAKGQEGNDLSYENSWNSLKFSFAKRLLILANNDNKFIRTKAVRQLARIKTLDHWHFSLLSNMIDARTAVGLARTENADPRLFTEPPLRYLSHTQNMIVDVMKDLLVKLHTKSQHPCMGYFISRAFVDLHDVGRFGDHDTTPIELKKYIQSTHEVLPMCLESLLHHASVEDYAIDIAELNGLPLLMEIYNRFKDNIEITATICRIISYLSMHQELLDDLFKSGWISVLAQWVKHDDVRISIPASKALANLDRDETPVYLQRLYPLHPTTRLIRKADADIVFVHGLLGGVFFTWRQRIKDQDPLGLLGKNGNKESIMQETCPLIPIKQAKKSAMSSDPDLKQFMEDLEEHLSYECPCKDYDMVWEDIPTNTNHGAKGPFSCPGHSYAHGCKDECFTYCWPRDWLAHDCEHLRIIGVNYETNLSMWAPICPIEKMKTLDERSDELIYQLTKVELGKRPIIWVTHSMGGLMVKNILSKSFESRNKSVKDICLNTKGIVFYSTPHYGSRVANLSQASSLVLWPSIEVQELQQNSPKLLEIHDKFLNLIRKIPIKVVTFIETQPTIVTALKFKFLVVEPHSGNPGVGEYYEIPLDHLGICKPTSRHSFLYQKVLHLIKDITNSDKPM